MLTKESLKFFRQISDKLFPRNFIFVNILVIHFRLIGAFPGRHLFFYASHFYISPINMSFVHNACIHYEYCVYLLCAFRMSCMGLKYIFCMIIVHILYTLRIHIVFMAYTFCVILFTLKCYFLKIFTLSKSLIINIRYFFMFFLW